MSEIWTGEEGVFEKLNQGEVRALADELLLGDAQTVERAVQFVCAETINHWHGRGRAMMCRRMKHIPLLRDQAARLVVAILARLSSGQFSEQFRDQLRLAMHLDREGSLLSAQKSTGSSKLHVRRLAQWVLSHEEAVRSRPSVGHS